MGAPRCKSCGCAKRGISPAGFKGIIWHCKNMLCQYGFTLRGKAVEEPRKRV